MFTKVFPSTIQGWGCIRECAISPGWECIRECISLTIQGWGCIRKGISLTINEGWGCIREGISLTIQGWGCIREGISLTIQGWGCIREVISLTIQGWGCIRECTISQGWECIRECISLTIQGWGCIHEGISLTIQGWGCFHEVISPSIQGWGCIREGISLNIQGWDCICRLLVEGCADSPGDSTSCLQLLNAEGYGWRAGTRGKGQAWRADTTYFRCWGGRGWHFRAYRAGILNFYGAQEPIPRDSASLCSLAGRYDNPIPTRCLAPIDCLKIPELDSLPGQEGTHWSLYTFITHKILSPRQQFSPLQNADSISSAFNNSFFGPIYIHGVMRL